MKGFTGIAIKLIQLGADIHAPPAQWNGRTALEGAAEYGRLDMLRYLWDIERGTGFGEEECKRAMDLAKRNGHFGCHDLLRSFLRSPRGSISFNAFVG